MEIDEQGLLADEKEEEEEEEETSSKKQKITQIEQPEIFVDKVKSTNPSQHTNHKAQSTTVAAERSKEETDGKIPLFVNEWQNMGTYHLVSKKEAFFGTEEFKGFNSNMHKFQGKEPLISIESTSKETSCLMSNVHGGTESSDECNKGKISLLGVRKQKNGRYGAVITDKIRHKQVWLGTFDTVKEASQAYFSKKSEFEKLSQQDDKDNKPKENLDQVQQIESPIVTSLSVGNDQTLDTASLSRIDSHETTTHIVEVHKNNWSGKEPESYKETSCLMANVYGIESYDECNTTRSCNPKAKISLVGVRRQKTGRYGAVITDQIRHKQVWLGTFDTVEEASQAYFCKKSEFEKLKQQGNKDNKPKENCDQIKQPESPVVLSSLSVANDQALDTASVGRRNRRIDSHETTPHIVEVHKNKRSGEEPESYKETPCLMASVNNTESSDECNTSTSNLKAKISLLGVRRQKNGRCGAVITDQIRHKQVWLGTFDTVKQASQAYFSKKAELENEKLNQQHNEENTPKKNCEQIQQPESPVVLASLSVADVQTLDTASVGMRNERIDFHGITHIVGVHKSKMSEKEHEFSKEASCLMDSVHGTESSDQCNTSTSNPKDKISLIGVRRQKNGRYGAVITDTTRHKQVWLGTFDTVDEASQAYFSKKFELKNEKLNQQGNKENRPNKNTDQIQQPESPVVATLSVADVQTLHTASVVMKNERIEFHRTSHIVGVHKSETTEKEPESSKETSCLMVNVQGTESSNECNTTNGGNPKAKRSLLGIRRQKNGRYGAVIRDTTRHKQVWLGTFDTVEQASQAYFSKKSELEYEKLNQQGNKENCDQIQQPEAPIVASLSVANDQTLNAASVDRRNKRINSHKATTHIVGVHKNGILGKEPEPSKETARLMDNVHGTESCDECNTTTSCDSKAKISLIGIRRQKNGRYGAVIKDRIKHKTVWLGTFDTVEEASQAYLSKKSELKRLGQQGDKENKPKKDCDQVQQPESPVVPSLSVANHDQTLNSTRVSRRNKKIDSHKTTQRIFRVHKRKDSGKYTSEIRNPITKKRIWLGTFGTAEEASRAYQSKKLEFERLVHAKRQCGNEQTHSTQDEKSEKLVNVKSGHENVNRELESAGGSEINVPISNSSNGGTEERIDSHEIGTAEEAFRAYQSKKFDLQNSKEVELQSDIPTDSSAGEKQEGQEDDEDLRMGEWVQLPGNRAVKFSLKLGLPIIDNYGSLLGEFSTLDDLSICKTDDGNET